MFLKFYGLTTQPFGVTPDPRFLYFGKSHREVWASLTYGIETGRGFMALIAPPGMGKTTLLLQLLDQFRGNARSAFIFQQLSGSADFMRALLSDLGLEPTGNDLGLLTKQLNDVLVEELHHERHFLLVLDEAQNLDDSILETVRSLSNFETPNAKLMQIILAGQPQLADKLGRWELVQLRQRISILSSLQAFDFDDVERYIHHRLRTAGHPGRNLFTRQAVREITVLSGGIPRNINDICFHALSLGYSQSRRTIDEFIVREAASDLSLARLGSKKPKIRRSAPEPAKAPVDKIPVVVGDRGLGDKDWVGSIRIEPSPAHSPAWSTRTQPSTLQIPRWMIAALVLIGSFFLADHFLAFPPELARASIEESLGIIGQHVDAILGHAPSANGPTPSPSFAPGAPAPDSLRSASTGTEGLTPASNAATAEGSTAPGGDAPNGFISKSPESSVESQEAVAAENPDSAISDEKPEHVANPAVAKHLRSSTKVKPPHETLGELFVSSDVPRAKIYLNGATEPDWTTPYRFFLRRGTYRVSLLKPGFKPTNDWITIRGRQTRQLNVRIGSNSETGGLIVTTEPSGLRIFIDGRPYGATELYTELSPGSHVLRIIPPPGREPYITTIRIRAGVLLKKTISWPETLAPPSIASPDPGQPS